MQSIIFLGITLLSLILFYYGTGKDKKVLLLSFLWILVVGLISHSGYFTNISAHPSRFLLMMLVAVSLSIFLYQTVKGNKLNAKFLVAVHTLRLPIELVLFQLFLQKKVPILMTYKGWNFDIVMGISAIFFLLYLVLAKNEPAKTFVFGWNLAGLVFLTTIVTIAILSSPLPIQQLAFDQPNIAVLQFPIIYLPAFIVPVVFLSHILTIKISRSDWLSQ